MSLLTSTTYRPMDGQSHRVQPPLRISGTGPVPGLWWDLPPAEEGASSRTERATRRRLEGIATAAGALGAGEGDAFVPVEGEDDMSLLARAFNAMAAQVRAREERLRAALHREQRIASTLQQAFLPKNLPSCPGYGFAVVYHPALQEAEVGGDFYDIFALPDGRIGLLLGDVAGKGLAAANTATMTRYMTRAYALQSGSPAAVLGEVNRALCDSIDDPGLFVTAFYAVLEPATGLFSHAAAGHWPALLAHSEGVAVVGDRSLALGISAEAPYEEGQVRLERGDGLLLYTDGLVEVGEGDPMEQLAAVQRSLGRRRASRPELWVEGLYQAALRRSGGRMRDDVTLLALRRD